MVGSPRRFPLFALGAIGIAVLVAGLALAMLRLPEWRNREIPNAAELAPRLQEAAGRAGLVLESAPRAQLRSRGWMREEGLLGEHDSAYDALGRDAADWLAREGRGPYVETVARSRWLGRANTGTGSGELRVIFSLRGVPIAAMWIGDDPFGTTRDRKGVGDARRQAMERIFVPTGVRETELTALGETFRIAPIPHTTPNESLLAMSISGPNMPYAQRIVGESSWWRRRLEALT